MARFTATVDLPTPPLPDATPMMCATSFTWSRFRSSVGFFCFGSSLTTVFTSTSVPPGALRYTAALTAPTR